MAFTSPTRWSGVLLIAGGVLWIMARFSVAFPPPLGYDGDNRLFRLPLLLVLAGWAASPICRAISTSRRAAAGRRLWSAWRSCSPATLSSSGRCCSRTRRTPRPPWAAARRPGPALGAADLQEAMAIRLGLPTLYEEFLALLERARPDAAERDKPELANAVRRGVVGALLDKGTTEATLRAELELLLAGYGAYRPGVPAQSAA